MNLIERSIETSIVILDILFGFFRGLFEATAYFFQLTVQVAINFFKHPREQFNHPRIARPRFILGSRVNAIEGGLAIVL